MGEAKRRGTFEERKAEGEAKRLERIRVESELRARRGKSRMPAMMAIALAMAAANTKP